jgi:hypothetical protein
MIPPSRPTSDRISPLLVRFAITNVLQGLPPRFIYNDDALTNALNAPYFISGEWFDSFAAKFERHTKAQYCVSTSSARQRVTRGCSPPCTKIWDRTTPSLLIFAKIMLANLLEDKLSSLSDNTEACKPPPLLQPPVSCHCMPRWPKSSMQTDDIAGLGFRWWSSRSMVWHYSPQTMDGLFRKLKGCTVSRVLHAGGSCHLYC